MRLQITQQSQEWHDLRQIKIGSSDAASIMGLGFDTPYKCWKNKVFNLKTPVNKPMQQGIELEPIARSHVEQSLGISLEPAVFISDEHPFMMASLDCYNDDKKLIIEIKCSAKMLELARQGIIPEYYMIQCQHQLATLGLDSMKYAAFFDNQVELIDINRDEKFIKLLIQEEAKFNEFLSNKTHPPYSEDDYIEQTSFDWELLAQEWIEVNDQVRLWKKKEEDCRQRIIDMCNQRNAEGANLRVTKVVTQGRVDYESIPELLNVDKEPYRKTSTISFRLTKI